jgi:hypothetical protein
MKRDEPVGNGGEVADRAGGRPEVSDDGVDRPARGGEGARLVDAEIGTRLTTCVDTMGNAGTPT